MPKFASFFLCFSFTFVTRRALWGFRVASESFVFDNNLCVFMITKFVIQDKRAVILGGGFLSKIPIQGVCQVVCADN